EVITDPDSFSEVREALEKEGIPMLQAEVTMIPQNWVDVHDDETVKKMNRLLGLLDEDDDVQNVYHNWDE
ncbi:MAG: YebC/PmpR family DNA-binding transcriptional regulator, partial [Lachnospiraceae bacterium]|nr:YebC/PmpR family DNA-binding transcriptional regulator [Lachnospiraceae bacterium]